MQRQLRLGDILDDYCPRERRVTNHAVVAMVGADVKQTRCATCDAEHEYKHAKVPRPRRKDTPAALHAQILASGPKRAVRESEPADDPTLREPPADVDVAQVDAGFAEVEHEDVAPAVADAAAADPDVDADADAEDDAAVPAFAATPRPEPEGPAHRRLIRATLPRLEGQAPAARPAPEFTIRTPATGRPNRFRPRHPGQGAPGNRPGQPGGQARGGASRGGHANTNGNSNRSSQPSHQGRRFEGRKRSK